MAAMGRPKAPPVKIVVDVHERQSGIADTLAELGAEIEITALRAGDLDRGPLHHNAVRGVCLAVIDQGIALLRSGYQRHSALWIHRLAVRCQQLEPAAERPAYAQRPRPKPGDETAEALLASVPGISTTSARALLEQFGSVAAVVSADPADLRAVPGIGPERARALEQTFNLRRGSRDARS
jgi:ERCC4-type nuclease